MKSFFNFLLQFSSSFFFSLFFSFRPLNLFLIVLTQTLVSVFLLNNSLCISNIFTLNYIFSCIHFYFLVLATVLSATGGYILNDVFDRKIDLINSPKRGIFTEKNLSLFYFLSSLFFGMALFFGFTISLQIGICVLISVALLIFYAKYSKKLGIFKPILVSFLTAFSIVLVGLEKFNSFSSIPILVWIFSVWAFLLSMCREIIKDLEDFKGDNSQNSFTSVIQLGTKKSILLLNFLSIFLVLSILFSIFISTNTLYTSIHKILMIILLGIFSFLLTTSSSLDYKKMSLFCKIMMLIGILGMIVY